MSTCPDKSLYSAFVDGEVPPPWKEMLEEHLASCEKCRVFERQYRGICNALQKIDDDNHFTSREFLESSFDKLSARWEIATEKAATEQGNERLLIGRKSARIPYFALAAMLAVAAFVPSFFVAKTMEGRVPNTAAWLATQNSSDSMLVPAPSQNGASGYTLAAAEQADRDFSLINQAKMFAQDKKIFSFPDEGYVIIKLPRMVRFSTELERLQSEREIFSYTPAEMQRNAQYIINARQDQY